MMRTRVAFSLAFVCQRWLCFTLAVVFFSGTASAEDAAGTDKPGRPLGEIDVNRIRELYHITDTFGDEIWPGFDTRKTPVAINNDEKEELLIGHPHPPEVYRPFQGFELNGQPVMIRDGVTYYRLAVKGGATGGGVLPIGGKPTAYVSIRRDRQSVENYLSVLLHECFHCFQRDYRQPAEGGVGQDRYPEDDPVYSAMIGLEGRVLRAAVDEPSDEKARKLAEMFVAVRHQRRKDLPEGLVIQEGNDEYNEGTARYSQVRMYQLIAEKGFKPLDEGNDPDYHGFRDAKSQYEEAISRIRRQSVPLERLSPELRARVSPITFHRASYEHGMAQCLVLDRVRPGWKEEMREKGMTQFALLEKEFPLEEGVENELLAEARKRFDYENLLAEQKMLVDQRLDLIRGYVAAPGRIYRVYYGSLGGYKSRPAGPVYHIPESLEKELAEKRKEKKPDEKRIPGVGTIRIVGERRSVWVGGIRRMEWEGVLFESGDTPVIRGMRRLEWIDRDPAPDQSDMKIESEREENGIHFDVKITTDGFTLKAEKARIEWSKDLVEIYPMPK